jgi:oligosaccharyltransferase complex subunit alpha (ribophorin I)
MSGRRDTVYYKVDLSPHRATKDEEFDLKIVFVLTRTMKPLPEFITQSEPQLVVYRDSHYWLSPYKTALMWSEVKMPSPQIENYSKLPPTQVKGNTIQYGPYENVPPNSFSALTLHFESNIPFFSATKSVRILRSHRDIFTKPVHAVVAIASYISFCSMTIKASAEILFLP